MAHQNKTQPTNQTPDEFINGLEDEQVKKDCFEIIEMMKLATGHEAQLWVGGLIGFGTCKYKSATGTSGNWFLLGFAPRKQNISIYLMGGIQSKLLEKLGKYKTGKGCLYIKKLADVDKPVLQQLMNDSVKTNRSFLKA